MEKRKLGNTGIELSLAGFGGFHLVEISSKKASHLLNRYLDMGGNYIETAAEYGHGNSEKKIGNAVSHRRDEFFLATKVYEREYTKAADQINKSLENLKTDYVDILFMHHVQTDEELDEILSETGALRAAVEAKEKGKASLIAISGHGHVDTLLKAVKKFDFDVLMTHFNYYDKFNFPIIENELLPYCIDKGMGVLAMKAIGDGYLYRSWDKGIIYTLSLPITSLVLGMNTQEYLEKDMKLIENFVPMSEADKEILYKTAPELGDYVCRQCGKCASPDFNPAEIFLLEGMYDRQMNDKKIESAPDYSMQRRLGFWFGQKERAKIEYRNRQKKVDIIRDYSELNRLCPYGIDIDRKLKICHEKLGADNYVY